MIDWQLVSGVISVNTPPWLWSYKHQAYASKIHIYLLEVHSLGCQHFDFLNYSKSVALLHPFVLLSWRKLNLKCFVLSWNTGLSTTEIAVQSCYPQIFACPLVAPYVNLSWVSLTTRLDFQAVYWAVISHFLKLLDSTPKPKLKQ